jgi:hypothetical protein
MPTVVELKAALTVRGLVTTGSKAVLEARLAADQHLLPPGRGGRESTPRPAGPPAASPAARRAVPAQKTRSPSPSPSRSRWPAGAVGWDFIRAARRWLGAGWELPEPLPANVLNAVERCASIWRKKAAGVPTRDRASSPARCPRDQGRLGFAGVVEKIMESKMRSLMATDEAQRNSEDGYRMLLEDNMAAFKKILARPYVDLGAEVKLPWGERSTFGGRLAQAAAAYGCDWGILRLHALPGGRRALLSTNLKGETAAHKAAKNGHDRSVRAIYDVLGPLVGAEALRARRFDGQTPAHRAAKNGHSLTTLVALAGLNVELEEDNYGHTPAMHALKRGKSQVRLREAACKKLMKDLLTLVPGQKEWKVAKKYIWAWVTYKIFSAPMEALLESSGVGTKLDDIVGIFVVPTCASMLTFFVVTPALGVVFLYVLYFLGIGLSRHAAAEEFHAICIRVVIWSLTKAIAVFQLFGAVTLVVVNVALLWCRDTISNIVLLRTCSTAHCGNMDAESLLSSMSMPCLHNVFATRGLDENLDGELTFAEAADIFDRPYLPLDLLQRVTGLSQPGKILLIVWLAEIAIGLLVYSTLFLKRGTRKTIVKVAVSIVMVVWLVWEVTKGKFLCNYTSCVAEKLDLANTLKEPKFKQYNKY